MSNYLSKFKRISELPNVNTANPNDLMVVNHNDVTSSIKFKEIKSLILDEAKEEVDGEIADIKNRLNYFSDDMGMVVHLDMSNADFVKHSGLYHGYGDNYPSDGTYFLLVLSYTDNLVQQIAIDETAQIIYNRIFDDSWGEWIAVLNSTELDEFVTKDDLDDYALKTEIPTSLPANGGNSNTVNGHTVEKDVPSNADFTNTWRGIQNNLTSSSTTDSLSAYQGKLLRDALTNEEKKCNITNGGVSTIISYSTAVATIGSDGIIYYEAYGNGIVGISNGSNNYRNIGGCINAPTNFICYGWYPVKKGWKVKISSGQGVVVHQPY